jgi:hypothetical protein
VQCLSNSDCAGIEDGSFPVCNQSIHFCTP